MKRLCSPRSLVAVPVFERQCFPAVFAPFAERGDEQRLALRINGEVVKPSFDTGQRNGLGELECVRFLCVSAEGDGTEQH